MLRAEKRWYHVTVLADIYQKAIESGGLTEDKAQRAAIMLLQPLLDHFARPPKRSLFRKPVPPQGLYLHGGVGRGKTMVMDMFFNAVPITAKRRVHFHAFMLEVHEFLHARRQARAAGNATAARIDGDLVQFARHLAKDVSLLCFDEFQVKDVADAMILGRLFTAVIGAGVAVIMTSNIAPDDLYRDGLQRDRFLPFIDLIKTRMKVFCFDGDRDYRLDRLMGKKNYFWPADADARAALRRLFDAVAEGAEAAPAVLDVKGRQLHIPLAAREAALFDFKDLCGQALGAVDYLALARRFRFFVIENVPQLDDSRRDQALRFVTLIDTLYEHRAQIALSAAMQATYLYKGEFHGGVFERTVSRLMEMQSDAYRSHR